MRARASFVFVSLTATALTALAPAARAEDVKPLVSAPTDPADAPKIAKPTDGSSATLSAGALMTTGNSYLLAGTANGAYERHFGYNSVGAAAIGNYGESRAQGAQNHATAENLQGKLRYDRYLTDDLTAFMMVTGRTDRFQGVLFRMNLDPGVKYLFVNQNTTSLWGEAGYDFQYDTRREDSRQKLDDNGKPLFDTAGNPVLVDKTATDHSARLYAGYKYAFSSDVTFKAGAEYLQSVVKSTQWRMNFDALVAAKLRGGLALGVGFSARYDHAPLPGKEELDTATNVSLIYSFADPSPKKADPCNCPPPAEPAPAPEGAAPPATPATPAKGEAQ
jgi:putative salt-induced outer membrane protein YdiY